MEIHGQLNVRVMLWYKSVSLLLLKLVRTVAVPLLQALKKKRNQNQHCLKKATFVFSVKASWVFSFLLLLSLAFPLVPFGGIGL